MNILTINIGSRSKKYSLFSESGELLKNIEIEGVAENSFQKFLKEAKADAKSLKIGFRIVAPGKIFTENKSIDANYLKKLAEASKISPLHIDPVLKEIENIKKKYPKLGIYAISDSSFHKTIPQSAKVYAIPRQLAEKYEIERQGYHGLSIQSVLSKIDDRFGGIPEKLIVCHLGGGSSVTAVLNGRSLDTSMGWTPIEGVPMAERSGSIDPGVLSFICGKLKLSGAKLGNLLETRCGLEAISGVDKGDIRILIENENRDDEVGQRARLALEVYIHSVRKEIGRMIAVLGGCNALVLTGAVGERSPIIRHKLIQNLGFLNIYLHEDNNWAAAEVQDIALLGSPIDKSIIVIKSDEAREMFNTLSSM